MTAAPPEVAETRWGIVLIACGAGVVGAFQIGKMPSSLPVLRQDLELSLVAADRDLVEESNPEPGASPGCH